MEVWIENDFLVLRNEMKGRVIKTAIPAYEINHQKFPFQFLANIIKNMETATEEPWR